MVLKNRNMLLIVKNCAVLKIKKYLYCHLNIFVVFVSFCFTISKATRLTKKCIGFKVVFNDNDDNNNNNNNNNNNKMH